MKSKALQEELESLKHKLAKRNEDDESHARDDLSRDVDSGVLSKPSSRDGAMKQNKAHTSPQSVNQEVIISRLEAAQLDTESYSTITQSKPLKTNIEQGVSNACKEENVKLKQQITQMKEVYENHIKVCTNWSARKSLSSTSDHHESACAEEMRRKIIILEKTINDLESNLKYKERYCGELQQEVVRIKSTEISPNAVSKLEEFVDLIMKHKQQSASNINCTPLSSSSFSIDTEVLKSVVSNSLHSLQDELIGENQTVRQTIKNSTKEILSAVQSIHAQNTRKLSSPIVMKKDSRSVNVSGTRRSPCIVRSKAGIESIEEIEGIKDRIDNLQQLVFGRENEVRKIEMERDRLSDELIRMVDAMKKKDEECGYLFS